MLNLMAATGAGGDDDGVAGLGLDFFDEGLRDFQGKFVFGGKRAVSAGHATAAGFQQGDFTLRQALRQPRHRTCGIGERLGVAMRMDGHGAGFFVETKRIGFLHEQVFNELLEKKTARGNRFRARKF